MNGCFQAIALVPIISEVQRAHSDIEDKKALNDKVCGAFSSAFALGEFLGPLVGNFLFSNYGFKTTTYIFSGITTVFAIVYFLSTIER